MLIVELDKKTLAALKKKTSLRGQLKKIVDSTGVSRSTILRVKAQGTASEEVVEKLEGYLFESTAATA